MASQYESIDSLIQNAADLFRESFKIDPSIAVCAPGRVNLIGDHVDYNGGFVLPMALPMVTLAVGKLNDTNECHIVTGVNPKVADDQQKVHFLIPSDRQSLQPGHPKWANYVKGVVACFHGEVKGFDCVILSSLPIGAGLSSSAAIEVAVYTLLEHLLDSPAPSLKDKALACQRAEHLFAKVPCGIMDQFISTMGKEGHALFLDCKSMEAELIPLLDFNVCFVIIDTGIKHQLTGSEYPQRRSQCEAAAQHLNEKLLRDVNRESLEAQKSSLDPIVYSRALHVVNEIGYTIEFVDCLKNKKYSIAGQLMIKSHQSLRDLYNVSCPEADFVVNSAINLPGVFGARMTGAGFGGCVVALVETEKGNTIIKEIKNQCLLNGFNPTFYICSPCEGARFLKRFD